MKPIEKEALQLLADRLPNQGNSIVDLSRITLEQIIGVMIEFRCAPLDQYTDEVLADIAFMLTKDFEEKNFGEKMAILRDYLISFRDNLVNN